MTTINEFPLGTTNGSPLGITAGPDGNVWFTEDIGKIGRITPAGVITEFTIPTASSHPAWITAGPDGNLWFVEDGPLSGPVHNHIGVITPGGAINEFTIATFPSSPTSIAAGPDGNLWFTEFDANRIGRITPKGDITEFPIPGSETEPESIVAGPDGGMWFTEENSKNIGRIATSGVVTQFPYTDFTDDITAGPDGNLWFTAGTKLARISTAGVVTALPLPVGLNPTRLTAGPDGNVWFTSVGKNEIDRITPAGDLARFPIPTADSIPQGITTGPDGNIWFTESTFAGSKIGRIVVGADTSLSGSAAGTVKVGQHVTYSLTVTSDGTAGATGVTLTDTLPAGVRFISATGGVTPVGGVLKFPLGNLAIGAKSSVTIVVAPTATGTLSNQASVSSNEKDQTPADNSVTLTTTAQDIVVNTTSEEMDPNDDTISLLEAVLISNASPGQTITFDPAVFPAAGGGAPGKLIDDSAVGLLELTSDVKIVGPGANALAIKGGGPTSPSFPVFGVDPGVTATLSGLTITGGYSPNGVGGGIYNNGQAVLSNCTVAGNSSLSGGGIYCYANATLTLNNCTVANNTATADGGGIASRGSVVLNNCTVAGNISADGGGIHSVGGTLTVNDSTVAANRSRGIVAGSNSTVLLRNTIVAGNFLGAAPATTPGNYFTDGSPVNPLSAYNLFGPGADGFTDGVNHNQVGADPLLGPLQDNGGPTQTMALLVGSPAFDAGSNALVPSDVNTDQRGLPRVFDGTVDIGAVESQQVLAASNLVVNTTDDEITPGDGKTSLREAIAFANASPGQTITFDPAVFPAAGAATIQLIDDPAHGKLELKSSVKIVGPGAKALVVKGGGAGSNFSVFKVDAGVTATLSGLNISSGNASFGGGIINSGQTLLTNCTIANNSAETGGGIYSSAGLVTLMNCTIATNAATKAGGGISSSGSLMLTNCTVAGNSSPDAGGIMSAGTLTTTNCTIAGNRSTTSAGGGIAVVGGTALLGNTIVAGNFQGAAPATTPGDILGTVNPSSSFNLIGTGGSGGLTTGVNRNLVGLDPLLGPLQDNGGPTQTMALLDGSPAIDAGSNTLVPAGVRTDQRGLARIIHGIVDIGAFESQTRLAPPSLVVNTTDDELIPGDGKTSLREAITLANALGGGAITFDPAVFAGHETITLSQALPDLSGTARLETIVGPGAGVTIARSSVAGTPKFRILNVDKGVSVTLSHLTLSGGFDDVSDFGGVVNLGTLTASDCTISDNVGTGISNGDGSYGPSGPLTLTNCTIAGNVAVVGGGVYNRGTLALTNCTIVNNTARSGGGVDCDFGTLTLTNCTIAGNRSLTDAGGGIEDVFGRTVILRNSIVAGNFQGAAPATTPGDILGKVNPASTFNLIGTGGSGGLTTGVNRNLVGLDPVLGPLQDNGGPTQTMALLDGSPAIDAGSNALLPTGVRTDQRGLARIVHGIVDIGAFESQTRLAPPSLVVNTTDDELIPGDGKTSLREAITLANVLGGGAITFDPAVFAGHETITLSQALPDLSGTARPETIVGPGAGVTIARSSVAGTPRFRILTVDKGVSVSLSHLTLSGGFDDVRDDGGVESLGTLTATDCIISDNAGSGIASGYVANNPTGPLTMRHCTIARNTAGLNGGGVFNLGTMTLTDCTIADNSAGLNGGGISNQGNLAVMGCTLSHNTAGEFGGAIFTSTGNLTLVNCTLASNAAGTSGGGIAAQGTVAVTSCTFTLNTAQYGGAIDNYIDNFKVTVADSILAGDSASIGGPDFKNTVISRGNNLIGETDSSSGWVASDLTGTIARPLNPVLAPLGNYGGPTQTMALLDGSPAFDAGSNALLPTDVNTDQRGLRRVFNGTVDIGAYESQVVLASPFVVNTTDDEITPGDGKTSLREAIAFANAHPGHTITFDPTVFPPGASNAIQLSTDAQYGTLELKASMTIVGPGAKALFVKGGGSASNFSVFTVDAGATVQLSGVTITGGHTGGYGGGINNRGSLTLKDCKVADSSAYGGGGITSFGGFLMMTNCTVANNSSLYGGGIYAYEGTATLVNCTIAGNLATYGGGFCLVFQKLMTLTNCTVANNRSVLSTGGGMEADNIPSDKIVVNNTIVAGNFSGAAPSTTPGDFKLDDFAKVNLDPSSAYNLIGTGGSGGLVNGVNRNLVGLDPVLGPLQDNGGPTQTMALLDGSPAFDAGSNALLLGVRTDQRGLARIVHGIVDIGAFESQTRLAPPSLVVNTTDDELIPGDGKTSLREAITLANARGGGTITFDPAVFPAGGTATIQLSTYAQYGTLELKASMRIVGPGAKALSVKGGGLTSHFSVFTVDPGAAVDLSGLTITRGHTDFYGGGINNRGALTMKGCTVSDSRADGGGGIFSGVGSLTMSDCTVTNNSSRYGGGIEASAGTATLVNCTISGNVADSGGGGIYLLFNMLTTLTNCTVANNTSDLNRGGGMEDFGVPGEKVVLTNTIVANNRTVSDPLPHLSDLKMDSFLRVNLDPSSAYNLLGLGASGGPFANGDSGGLVNGVNHNRVGIDPRLGPLQDNGGPTQTMALLVGSPAIDAGSNALIAGTTTDQRGLPRVVDGSVDIGAYEKQDVAVRAAIGGRVIDLASTAGTALVNAVAIANPSPLGDYPAGLTAADFPAGFFGFTLNLEGRSAATVTLVLPPGTPQPTTYYKFGATPGNPVPHWYEFLYDGTTGAETHAQNPLIPFGRVVLHFVDGQRGDDDLSRNGIVVDPGGPAFSHGTVTAEAAFVTALYRDLLGRLPAAMEAAASSQFLASRGSRSVLAQAISPARSTARRRC